MKVEMVRPRAIKVGATIKVRPECFNLTGLPESARGELRVDEYGSNWNGRYTLEVSNREGDCFNVMESEVIEIRP